MTADREQIRRRGTPPSEIYPHGLVSMTLAERDALLDELEQAEKLYRQRYDWAMHERDVQQSRAEAAEARLAKAPALVEALSAMIDVQPYFEAMPRYALKWNHERDKALDLAAAALKTWGET